MDADVGTLDPGVSVVLLSFEIWTSRIVLHIAAQHSDLADAIQVGVASGFDARVATGAIGGLRGTRPGALRGSSCRGLTQLRAQR